MGALILKQLMAAKENNELVAIRSGDKGSGRYSVGYILMCTDVVVSIKAINPKGLVDGIFTIKTDDIFGLDMDDKYINRLQDKMEFSDQIYEPVEVPVFFSNEETDVKAFLEMAKDEEQLIHISLYKKIGMFGYVQDVSDEEFQLMVYNDAGEYDGVSVYYIDDIKNISWDDEDIRLVEVLIQRSNLIGGVN